MPTNVSRWGQRKVVAAIVRLLYQVKANEWTVQEKGELMAAIKLQLSETENRERVSA